MLWHPIRFIPEPDVLDAGLSNLGRKISRLALYQPSRFCGVDARATAKLSVTSRDRPVPWPVDDS
jgi:hypothetical protein